MTVSASQQPMVESSLLPPKSSLKRTAKHARLSPAPKKRRASTPNSSTQSRFTSAVRPPEPLSINSSLQSRERLYIHPLQWVLRHLKLLGCQFHKKAGRKSKTRHVKSCVQDEPKPNQQGQAMGLSIEAITRAVDLLLYGYATTLKVSAVRHLLEDHGIPYINSSLPFRFNQQVVATLRTDGIFSRSSSDSASPILGYLDLETVRSRRNKSIMLSVCNGGGPPVARLQQKRQRSLQPTKEVEDPYVAAVLIALAQGQRHQQDMGARASEQVTAADTSDLSTIPRRFGPSPLPSDSEATGIPKEATTYFEAYLLALPAMGARSLYFYTARISSAFLDRFDRPSQYFPCDPMLISYYRIPLAPKSTVESMIGRAIFAVRGKVS